MRLRMWRMLLLSTYRCDIPGVGVAHAKVVSA